MIDFTETDKISEKVKKKHPETSRFFLAYMTMFEFEVANLVLSEDQTQK